MRPRVGFLLLGLGLLLAGCGGSEPAATPPSAVRTDVSTSTPQPTPTPPLPTSRASSPAAPASPAPVSSARPSKAGLTDLADAELPQFRTPSGAITCLFSDYRGAQVRCDVKDASWAVAAPADCPLEYGDSVTLTDRAALTCHGDTIFSPDVTITLAHGETAGYRGITCTSARTGVTCSTGHNAGFTLSRTGYRLR